MEATTLCKEFFSALEEIIPEEVDVVIKVYKNSDHIDEEYERVFLELPRTTDSVKLLNDFMEEKKIKPFNIEVWGHNSVYSKGEFSSGCCGQIWHDWDYDSDKVIYDIFLEDIHVNIDAYILGCGSCKKFSPCLHEVETYEGFIKFLRKELNFCTFLVRRAYYLVKDESNQQSFIIPLSYENYDTKKINKIAVWVSD